ncbi:ribosome modulation factor [Klebsiella pneumoniae subsp. pneumoniae]|nr:ribosome modulation factor [Klebsiella pneumoniae subsp. pneumoniae]
MRETRHEETRRDRCAERAHQRGYQAGIAGRSKEICVRSPEPEINARMVAGRGWREAMEDRVLTA